MAVRFYVVPKVEVTPSTLSPKYFRLSGGASGIAGWWAAINFGREPNMLVKADVTNAEHTAISGNSDVITIPSNIDATIGGGGTLNTVRNRLEAINIPGAWVTAGMTYRQVLVFVARLGLLHQRFGVRAAARFFETHALTTTMAQLTAAQRDRLREAATDLGVTDTSAITGASTVRDVLRLIVTQMTIPIRMGVGAGEVL